MNQFVNNFILVGDEDGHVFNHFRKTLKNLENENSKNLDIVLDTKYYKSNLRLHSFEDLRTLAIWRSNHKDLMCSSFCLVLKKSQTAFDLNKLEAMFELFDFDTKMIACYQSNLPIPFASSLSLWTNKNGFELIDIEPNESDIEYFKSNNEKYSFDRIIEVIESTEWHEKQNKKDPLNYSLKNAEENEEKLSDFCSDDDFNGELDDDEKKFLEDLLNGPSILDYYSGRGFDFKTIEGELSQIEEQEKAEKKAKQKARRKEKKKKEENGDASEDVEIELDKEDLKTETTDKTDTQAERPQLDSEEILGRIKELRETFKDKPRETRIDMAEMLTSAIMNCLEKDE